MADNTSIEWARHPVTKRGASWNPLLARRRDNGKLGYHCEHVSPGCVNCYAETFNGRNLPNRGTGLPFKPGHRKDLEIVLDEETLLQPLRWKAARGIFAFSMTDLFGEWVSDELIDRVFAVMALTPHHVYYVLTKRPERMRKYLLSDRSPSCSRVGAIQHHSDVHYARTTPPAQFGRYGRVIVSENWPLPNVWLGTSVEDQARADERIPHLLATPAAVRFVSAEPLLGPVDLVSTKGGTLWIGGQRGCGGMHHGAGTPECPRHLHHHHDERCGPGLDWVIVGGESGPGAREYRYSWGLSLHDQCAGAGIAFFHKQVGSRPVDDINDDVTWRPVALKDRKGGDMEEWPERLRVRQWPTVGAGA